MTSEETSGAAAAPPSFDSLKLTAEVRQALDEIGYEVPTPVQHAAYGPAVAGRDIIVQARTGTGKTAAFGIPLVDRIVTEEPGVQALVLAPTRELALQSAREIERLGRHRQLRTVAVYGGAPMQPQIKDLAEGAQIVSGTPGRVLDHLRRGTLDASKLRALVLDEMDEMLSMGFAKELNAILEIIPDKEHRQTMCFSATVDGSVQRHAENHMRDPQVVSLSSDAVGAVEISHYMYMVSGTDRTGDLIQVLNSEDPESAIVFCNMRSETEKVAVQLQQSGFNADWLNGDLPQRDRERIMARTREGKLRYLVATDVAARGIDISHLTHVINYSFPESAATYVHRTGRTGRAGRTGCAISLVAPQELGRLYYLRLEYGISPIERSLPNAGENRTRQELDRIKLLESSAGSSVSAKDLALARRLLTHPDVERILGGLLHAVFGEEDNVDDRAADARRKRNARPVVEARRGKRRDDEGRGRDRDDGRRRDRDDESKRRERDDEGKRRERDDESKRRERDDEGKRRERDDESKRRERDDEGKRREADGERRNEDGDRPRRRRRRREDDDQDDSTPRQLELSEGDGTAAEAAEAADTDAAPRRRRRRRSRDRQRDAAPAESPEHEDGATDDGEAAADLEDGEDAERPETGATIFLNVGRRDGARVGEIARLMRETGEMARNDVGRIRVRDRYTFVEVPEEQLDAVMERLRDAEFNERPLEPERAKVSRS